MHIVLEVVAGPDSGSRFRYPADAEFTFGRAGDADVDGRLPRDPALSRRHFAVRPTDAGWVVRDLGAAAGLRLDGAPVKEAPLEAGDELEAGGSRLRVILDVASPPPREAPRDRLAEIQTRWTYVRGLAGHDARAAEEAWGHLARTYQPAMERYVAGLLRRRAPDVAVEEDARDVVQGFLVDCFARGYLSRADPDRGRFRAFVTTLLRRHARDWARKARAAKRRPVGARIVAFGPGTDGEEKAHRRAETEVLDRAWSEDLLRAALSRLAAANPRYHALIEDLARTDGEGSADLAARIGVRPDQLPVLRFRARRRFAEILREEVVATVSRPDDLQDELEALRPWISRYVDSARLRELL